MKRNYTYLLILIGFTALAILGTVGSHGVHGQDTETSLPYPPIYFLLELESPSTGTFLFDTCTGLGSYNDINEVTVTTPMGVPAIQKTAGPLRWYDITLQKYEVCSRDTLDTVLAWRKAMEEGDLQYAITNGIIAICNPRTGEKSEWEFSNGWVSSLSFDDSTATVKIVHEGLSPMRDSPPGGRPFPDPPGRNSQ